MALNYNSAKKPNIALFYQIKYNFPPRKKQRKNKMILHKKTFKKHTAESCLKFRVMFCPQVYQITKLVNDIIQIYIFISDHTFAFNLDILIISAAWLFTPLKSYVNSRSALMLFASTEVHEIGKRSYLVEIFFFLGKSFRGLRQVNHWISFA